MKNEDLDQVKPTPKGLMNIWVGEQIRSIENMIDGARSSGATENATFLRGTLTGIRMLQMRWLDGDFDSDAV